MLQEIPPRPETCLQVSALSDIVNPDRISVNFYFVEGNKQLRPRPTHK